jgi:glycosyltransferase involved in cell wall biosynthesis
MIEHTVSLILMIFASSIAIPVAVFCVEAVACFLPTRQDRAPALRRGVRQRVAVVVPAHNESPGLASTLKDIKAQLNPADRLLVVADNCTDDTAAIAAAAGAEVVERHDAKRIGKGYALDFGIRHLSGDPPAIVVMIDADCRLGDGAIDRLAATCAMTHRPVQALYLMTAAVGSGFRQQLAAFAFRVKNWVRPLGLRALGLPCQLVGSGMVFPWDVICSVDLAGGSIVEDLKLGLDLAAVGHPPLFCPSARISSAFATTSEGADVQRTRWERGHIGTILASGPRLLFMAVAQGNLGLLALTLDMIIPPLSLLTLLLILTVSIATIATLQGLSSPAMAISTASLFGFVIVVFVSWLKYGREVLSGRAILSIPLYILWKLRLYHQIQFGRASAHWIRTDRAT